MNCVCRLRATNPRAQRSRSERTVRSVSSVLPRQSGHRIAMSWGKNEINLTLDACNCFAAGQPAIIEFRGPGDICSAGLGSKRKFGIIFVSCSTRAARLIVSYRGEKNCTVRHGCTRGTVACTIDPEGRRQRENRIRTSEAVPVVKVLLVSQ